MTATELVSQATRKAANGGRWVVAYRPKSRSQKRELPGNEPKMSLLSSRKTFKVTELVDPFKIRMHNVSQA
jgi:hypothetical protein